GGDAEGGAGGVVDVDGVEGVDEMGGIHVGVGRDGSSTGSGVTGGGVDTGGSAAGGSGGGLPDVPNRGAVTGGGLGATDAGSSPPPSGKRRGGRGPGGACGTSPYLGASSGTRPAAWPVSSAACASSAPMIRTPSLAGRGGVVGSKRSVRSSRSGRSL